MEGVQDHLDIHHWREDYLKKCDCATLKKDHTCILQLVYHLIQFLVFDDDDDGHEGDDDDVDWEEGR